MVWNKMSFLEDSVIDFINRIQKGASVLDVRSIHFFISNKNNMSRENIHFFTETYFKINEKNLS